MENEDFFSSVTVPERYFSVISGLERAYKWKNLTQTGICEKCVRFSLQPGQRAAWGCWLTPFLSYIHAGEIVFKVQCLHQIPNSPKTWVFRSSLQYFHF